MSLKGYKVAAGLVSIILVFVLLIAPIFIYAFLMGLTWDDNSPLPDWLVWFIILGGVVGTALLVPIHRFIICNSRWLPKAFRQDKLVNCAGEI